MVGTLEPGHFERVCRPVCAVAILIVGLLAGCLDGPAASGPQDHAAPLPLPQWCHVEPSPCKSDESSYTVEDLVLDRRPGDGSIGIRIVSLDRDLYLRNVTIRGFDQGIVTMSSLCSTCTIWMENVLIEGPGAGVGTQENVYGIPGGYISLQMPGLKQASVEATGLTIHGHETAFLLGFSGSDRDSRLHLSDVLVDCRSDGLKAWGVSDVHIENATVSDCDGTAIEASGFHGFQMTGARLRGNWQGVSVGADTGTGQMRIEQSVIADNEVGGLYLSQGDLEAEGNRFRGNGDGGHPDEYQDLPREVLHAVYIGGGAIDMKANCFEENPGWAVGRTVYGSVDATENWWGTPAGPRQGTFAKGDYQPPEPVDLLPGEIVESWIVAFPALDAPPASCSLD